jgi:hypothetical protein
MYIYVELQYQAALIQVLNTTIVLGQVYLICTCWNFVAHSCFNCLCLRMASLLSVHSLLLWLVTFALLLCYTVSINSPIYANTNSILDPSFSGEFRSFRASFSFWLDICTKGIFYFPSLFHFHLKSLYQIRCYCKLMEAEKSNSGFLDQQ